jgi:hypothetical protein
MSGQTPTLDHPRPQDGQKARATPGAEHPLAALLTGAGRATTERPRSGCSRRGAINRGIYGRAGPGDMSKRNGACRKQPGRTPGAAYGALPATRPAPGAVLGLT